MRDAFDHQGDDIGAYLLFKIILDELLLGMVQLFFGDQKNLFLFQLFTDVAPDRVELLVLFEHHGLYVVQYFVRGCFQVHIDLRPPAAVFNHPFQGCHPDPEEFVHIVGEDAQKAYPFPERSGRIRGLL